MRTLSDGEAWVECRREGSLINFFPRGRSLKCGPCWVSRVQLLARMVRVFVWITVPFQRQRPTRVWVPEGKDMSRFQ